MKNWKKCRSSFLYNVARTTQKSSEIYRDSTDMLDFSFSAEILGFVPHFYLTNALMGGPSENWILNPYSRLLRYSTALCSSSSCSSSSTSHIENRETLCARSNERFFFFLHVFDICCMFMVVTMPSSLVRINKGRGRQIFTFQFIYLCVCKQKGDAYTVIIYVFQSNMHANVC